MRIPLTKNREVYDFGPPYIIAELGANHNGDMNLAREMINQAKKAGADCVKFQTWTKDSIFSKKVYDENCFLSDDYRCRTDYTLKEIVEKFAISQDDLLKMKDDCDQRGIDCTATPFSPQETDFLVEKMKVPFLKIASMDVNNYPFLRHAALQGLPIVLSTGLSSLDEIKRAVKTIEDAGNKKIMILHCIAKYPPQDHEVNLNRMETLRNTFPYPVGFSDHSMGFSLSLAAVAKGACIIEKHFTLDKMMFGWDHKVSADFNELVTIVAESHRIHAALGHARIEAVEDKERIRAFRRSIVAKRDIKKGEVFKVDMLDFKRPGDGLAPEKIDEILGKTAKQDIAYDELLRMEDF